ncbi:anhydro-N-acetylmuramic acid kinase, partial [Escherichia coli]|nr:anhydro-N-acetylmuramic acid kinase [Escherichia coli]
ANLTLLPPTGPVLGFDCGPGNVLMDLWCERQLGQPYDAGGRWAASGRVAPALLTLLHAEPWLALPPPKSTGRDLFHANWLQERL